MKPAIGAAIFSRIERVAPAPYLETMLAANALRGGDLAAAAGYAHKIPAGPVKSELLGRIALARGEGELAREYFLAAPDVDEMQNWRMGQLITLRGYRSPPLRARLWRQGMHYYTVAARLAPLSERYLLAAGSQALLLRDDEAAHTYFQRGVDVDPTSADAYAGLGIVAYRTQNVALARKFAVLARQRDSKALILAHLDLDLANASQ